MKSDGAGLTVRIGRRTGASFTIMLVAAAAVLLGGATGLGDESDAVKDDGVQTVQLTIDYGDGVQKVFSSLAFSDKLTVLAALQAASKHPRGIKFKHQGEGESAFVTQIDDVANEGRGARNWTYSVNDKRADKSCGAWQLTPGDVIVWRFGP
jgi:hypothetical protein